MKRRQFRLKRKTGYFAAGEEFAEALQVLGDGAFRLFAWVCLRADRATGRLAFDRGRLAKVLGKSRRTLGRHLDELVRAGVCELRRAPNQHGSSLLRVRGDFWPYAAEASGPAGQEAAAQQGTAGTGAVASAGTAAEAEYLAGVREALDRPLCVQARFGRRERRLARAWRRDGVPLRDVRRAILLGSVRRSMAMINSGRREPIVSLRYFEGNLEEVRQGEWPEGYWRHLEWHLERCEEHWSRPRPLAPGADGPGQGAAARPGPQPSSRC